MSAIWSRRNFIRVSALCTIAAAVPVAAAKAAGKVVYGHVESIIINGQTYVVKGWDMSTAVWVRGAKEEEL